MNLREQRDPELRLGNSLDTEGVDKELTLSTGTVLGIFLALALSWAIFFGFGYTMGRKSLQQPPTADSTVDSNDQFGKFKPSAGTQTSTPTASTAKPTAETPSSSDASSATVTKPAAPAVAASEPEVSKPAPVERVTPSAPVPVVINNSATNPPAGSASVMVQIAAVSHKEDADVLTSALERRGYKVIARQDANDHLIHVQVGPFPTRSAAEAMRARLLGDGYNAILK